MKLLDHTANVYSQNGEDGIIARIFELLEPESKVCIEFGAWDGFHLSNTASLWTNGWRGVLIEGDAARFEDLIRRTDRYPVTSICDYVGFGATNSLEAILEREGLKSRPNLLSIDIDGDDLHVLSSLRRLKPLVIICEYNPHIPYFMDLHAAPGQRFGASIGAVVRVAGGLGYRLIALTKTNGFFVREQDFHRFQEFETSLERLAMWDNCNFILTDYDGNYVVARPTGDEWYICAPMAYDLVGTAEQQVLDTGVVLLSKTSLVANVMRAPRAVLKRLPLPLRELVRSLRRPR